MLRTFVSLFNFNFVSYTIYFIYLFNILSWSLHGVQAAPVRISVGPEERELGVSSRLPGLSTGTVVDQVDAFADHAARHSRLVASSVPSDATTSAMTTPSNSWPSTLASSTILISMSSASSVTTPCTSSSIMSTTSPVVTSSSSQVEVGGSSAGGTDIPASSPVPVWTSSVMPPASSEAPCTTSSLPPTSVTTVETSSSSPTIGGPSPVMPSASSETPSVPAPSLPPAVPQSVTTVETSSPSSPTPRGPSPVTPPASSETSIGTPSRVFPAPSVATTSESTASPATVTLPAGSPTNVPVVSGTSVQSVTPDPSPETISASSAHSVQSGPSSQTTSPPTSSPQSGAVSTQLAGSLIAIITVFSFLGLLSLTLGVIFFLRTRRRRIAQMRRLENRPSPPNLSSRFSVSTVASVMTQPRRMTLFSLRTRDLPSHPRIPDDMTPTTPLVSLQTPPDESVESITQL